VLHSEIVQIEAARLANATTCELGLKVDDNQYQCLDTELRKVASARYLHYTVFVELVKKEKWQ
jgi:hypothetical protein